VRHHAGMVSKLQRAATRPHRSKLRREPAKVTDWLQAFAALVAAVLAGWAALVALYAFRDQQDLNNNIREHDDRRYAARVAAWADTKDRNIAHIQNRSPVPLRGALLHPAQFVTLPGSAGARWSQEEPYYVGDIPPCLIVTVTLTGRTATGNASPLLATFDLAFSDPNGRWMRTVNGLDKVDPDRRVILNPELETLPITTVKQAEDCGEGG
jgi:hypothetical protein